MCRVVPRGSFDLIHTLLMPPGVSLVMGDTYLQADKNIMDVNAFTSVKLWPACTEKLCLLFKPPQRPDTFIPVTF